MDVDFEAHSYLHQLETLKRSPETIKSYEISNEHAEPFSSSQPTFSPDFRQKLHEINVTHQKKIYQNELVNKPKESNGLSNSGNKSMLKLAEQRPSAQISKDEIEKLRKSVLQANRPKNPWSDRESPLPSMNQQNHKMEEKPSLRSPLNVQTVSGEDTMFDARRAQPSIHSLSPASPLSNSTPSSSSSTGGNMKWQTPIKLDSPTETFHARPAAVASLKNGTKIDSNSYQTSTKPQTNHTKVKTYYHGGIPKPKTSDPPRNEAYGHKQYQKIYTQSPKTNYIQNGTSKQSTNFLKPDAKNEKVPSWRQSAVVVQKPPIEVVRSEPKLSPTTMDLKILEELEVESRKRMEILSLSKDAPSMVGQHIVGNCGKCKQQIFDNNNVTFALEKIYHDKCFSCDVCRLPLKGTRFFRINEQNYCEDDYMRYSMHNHDMSLRKEAYHEPRTNCVVCQEPIVETVLQALGKAYHPQCFRCNKCRRCLDGIPFAADAQGRIYCMEDYQDTLAPTCAACHRPIKAANDFGQIVRVVALNKEYHIDCFICEGCGTQLTNETDRQCYPLNNHLLCKNCHKQWKKYGGLEQPFTDL